MAAASSANERPSNVIFLFIGALQELMLPIRNIVKLVKDMFAWPPACSRYRQDKHEGELSVPPI